MSKVLFSWTQPKSGAPICGWKGLGDNWFLAAYYVLTPLIAVGHLIEHRFGGWDVFQLCLAAWMAKQQRIVRPRYQLEENGVRVKSGVFSEFYRWNEIEYYDLWPSWNHNELPKFHFKARRGRRRRVSWEILEFDPGQADERTLRGILAENLAGKNLSEPPREEMSRMLRA